MRTVVLDPGHGGHDPGALGPLGTRESERALDVCLRAEQYLKKYVKVLLTRRDDKTFVSLGDRAKFSNENYADVFLSYHFNSASSPDTALSYEGFTTDGTNNSDRLAEEVLIAHGKLCYWQKIRSDKSDGDLDKEANFAVIRRTHCPSMLMEGEFIHTVRGEDSILNPEHQDLRAKAIAIGILRFLGIDFQFHNESSAFKPQKPNKLPVEIKSAIQNNDGTIDLNLIIKP